MGSGSSIYRLSRQSSKGEATLSALQETSEELGQLLKTLKAQSSGLDPVQAAVVRDAHR